MDGGEFTVSTDLALEAGAQTILQVASGVRVKSVRNGNDQVIVMRGTDRHRQF